MRTLKSEKNRILSYEYVKYAQICISFDEQMKPPFEDWFAHYKKIREKHNIKPKDGVKEIIKKAHLNNERKGDKK